jgi:hypothetical protein
MSASSEMQIRRTAGTRPVGQSAMIDEKLNRFYIVMQLFVSMKIVWNNVVHLLVLCRVVLLALLVLRLIKDFSSMLFP